MSTSVATRSIGRRCYDERCRMQAWTMCVALHESDLIINSLHKHWWQLTDTLAFQTDHLSRWAAKRPRLRFGRRIWQLFRCVRRGVLRTAALQTVDLSFVTRSPRGVHRSWVLWQRNVVHGSDATSLPVSRHSCDHETRSSAGDKVEAAPAVGCRRRHNRRVRR